MVGNKTAFLAMAPGGGLDDAFVANKEKGFYNHFECKCCN